jgi:prepilin-type N-terminal cleavage/methylation domain-containing protein
MMRHVPTGSRRGFSLLEVMVALAILVVSLVILVDVQSTAAAMTVEAEQYVVAANLAEEKLTEVRLMLEVEGFQEEELYEEGEFDEFGDEALDIEFADLDAYKWEWLVTEIDMDQLEEIFGIVEDFAADVSEDNDEADGASIPDLASLGVSNESIGLMMARYVREVRVRVWWGDDSEQAEERGTEVVITTHAVNPSGSSGGVGMSGTGDVASPMAGAAGGLTDGANTQGIRGRGAGGRGMPSTGGLRGSSVGGGRGAPGGAR